MTHQNNQNIICFGEVLFDILPNGAVPGGAPMNVAYHLHKLKKNPVLITRIGNDEKGKQLLQMFSSHGMNTDFFQLDHQRETGKVYANVNEAHNVIYDIVKPVAWDFIEWDESILQAVSNAEYFIFGSLASRNDISQKTLFHLLESANTKVLDINLRAPHYSQKVIEILISKTDFLKLNNDELELISDWYFHFKKLNERANALMEKFNLSKLVITSGKQGSTLFWDGNEYYHPGYKVKVQDTIGSGDAFLAGFISKWIENADPDSILQFANAMGAFIATKTGACPDYEMTDVHDFILNQEKNRN